MIWNIHQLLVIGWHQNQYQQQYTNRETFGSASPGALTALEQKLGPQARLLATCAEAGTTRTVLRARWRFLTIGVPPEDAKRDGL